MTSLQANAPVHTGIALDTGAAAGKESRQIFPSIDMMRILCAILVISIHTRPFEEYGSTARLIFQQILPRVAVPFFFAVSGYFLSSSLFKKREFAVIVKYLKRIIFTYTLWTILYFLTVIPSITTGKEQFITALKRLLINFFIFGSYYHLWYFPALIFSVIVFAFFYKISKLNFLVYFSIVMYMIGVLGVSYIKIGNGIPLLNNLYDSSYFMPLRRMLFMGLPFFVLGYLIYKLIPYLIRISNNKVVIFSSIITLCFILEIYSVLKFSISDQVTITVFLYLLTACLLVLCIKIPLTGQSKNSVIFRYISNFTYYSHPFFILCIGQIFEKLFGHSISQTPSFFIVTIATVTAAFILCKINNKYLLKLMS